MTENWDDSDASDDDLALQLDDLRRQIRDTRHGLVAILSVLTAELARGGSLDRERFVAIFRSDAIAEVRKLSPGTASMFEMLVAATEGNMEAARHAQA